MKQRIVLLGPPASGKGTLADRLAREFQMATASPGTMLRAEKDAGSSVGIEVDRLTRDGRLCSDEIINSLVANWLEIQPGAAFAFDGYPRTIGQASALDSYLEKRNQPLELAVLLEAEIPTLQRRILRRAVCGCGFTTATDELTACSRCGSALFRRSDDRPEVLAERLQQYETKTRPVFAYYKNRGLLRAVSSEGSPNEVFAAVAQLLKS